MQNNLIVQVNGNDLIALGIPTGKTIGQILNQLLEMVMEGTIENNQSELLLWVKDQMREKENEVQRYSAIYQ